MADHDSHSWHQIHDFVRGCGLREHIPNNEIVLEDHTHEAGYVIPWRSVRSKVPERVIWASDCQRLLQLDCFSENFDPDGVYEALEFLLDRERLNAKAPAEPIRFDKITLPKIKRRIMDARMPSWECLETKEQFAIVAHQTDNHDTVAVVPKTGDDSYDERVVRGIAVMVRSTPEMLEHLQPIADLYDAWIVDRFGGLGHPRVESYANSQKTNEERFAGISLTREAVLAIVELVHRIERDSLATTNHSDQRSPGGEAG